MAGAGVELSETGVGVVGVGAEETDGGLAGDPSIVCWGEVMVAPAALLRGSMLVSPDGELGQELWGEIGGVGGIWWCERSAGVSFMTCASGEIGICTIVFTECSRSPPLTNPKAPLLADVGIVTLPMLGAGANLKGFSSSISAEGGGVVCP